MTTTTTEAHVARLYLVKKEADRVWLQIAGTSYQIELATTGPVTPSPQGRVRGVVRCSVWKLDEVSAGGAFIEPLSGRPRRVQGMVTGIIAGSNSVIIDVAGQPIVGDLPPRWDAKDVKVGSRVGLDVKEGSTFEPM
jgi:hypothetical protein